MGINGVDTHITLKSVRDYLEFNKNAGQIVLGEYDGVSARTLEKAGILHKIKSFFGAASAKEQNRETIAAIRYAIHNDSRLYSVSDEADKLLNQVKGTITAEKLGSILDTLDNLVDNSTEKQYLDMANNSISGQLAAKGAPGFLQSRGLDKNQKFMAWYNNAAVGYVLGRPGVAPGSWKEASDGLKEFHQFFDRCLNVFHGQNQLNAFVSVCTAGKILEAREDGSVDLEKTLGKACQLKEKLDLVDSSDEDHVVRDTTRVFGANLASSPDISEDRLKRTLDARTSIQMVALKKLGSGAPKEAIANALKDALQECKSQIESIIGKDKTGEPLSVSKEMRKDIQKLAIQCAVAFFDKEDKENLFALLNGTGGQALKTDLAKDPESDLKLLYDAIAEVAGHHQPGIAAGMKLE